MIPEQETAAKVAAAKISEGIRLMSAGVDELKAIAPDLDAGALSDILDKLHGEMQNVTMRFLLMKLWDGLRREKPHVRLSEILFNHRYGGFQAAAPNGDDHTAPSA